MSDPQVLLRMIQIFINSRIINILYHSFTLDPADIADGAGHTNLITVPGAALGDFVLIAPPYDCLDLIITGYVQAADKVDIRIQHEVGGANLNLGSGTWKVLVIRTG